MIKSRKMTWTEHVARMSEKRNAYRVLVGKPEGKGTLRTPRRRWEDNIKMDLRKIRWDDMDLIYLAEYRDQWRALVDTKIASNGRIMDDCELERKRFLLIVRHWPGGTK
jgi:hypothetical protein